MFVTIVLLRLLTVLAFRLNNAGLFKGRWRNEHDNEATGVACAL